jgi:hypothetical protein
MGGGSYSFEARETRATAKGYATKSLNQVFDRSAMHHSMNPMNAKMRESRDSEEHPESLAIIIALDLTGSMGMIPKYIVSHGLPNIMKKLMDSGIAHPQILFLGVGDHECDRAPLQVGQFESSDLQLDHWLTTTFIEQGGGSNAGESYLLAWYFAAMHTEIDCFEKRGQKGFLFTIGDEPTLTHLGCESLARIMGNGQYKDYSAKELLKVAEEHYHVIHLHIEEGRGHSQSTVNGWKALIGQELVHVQDHQTIADIISNKIKNRYTAHISKKQKIETKPKLSQYEDVKEIDPDEFL